MARDASSTVATRRIGGSYIQITAEYGDGGQTQHLEVTPSLLYSREALERIEAGELSERKHKRAMPRHRLG